MLSRYFCEVVCNVLTTQCEFQGTDTVLAVYCSAQLVLLCKCVKKVHVYNSFPIKFANAQQVSFAEEKQLINKRRR